MESSGLTLELGTMATYLGAGLAPSGSVLEYSGKRCASSGGATGYAVEDCRIVDAAYGDSFDIAETDVGMWLQA